jgi:D-beta-D-heptose 7-phosphate kinase/D-beta-D-heptose 1-phosphate adenosyltransferase
VAAVTPADIQGALESTLPSSGKIVVLEELLERVQLQKQAGRAIVLTNGCFDVLHAGHLEYLQQAAEEGDVLIVAVNDDASVTALKGDGRPVNILADRMALLAGFECVSLVTSFSEDTPLRMVEAITPDVLVKGAAWADKGVVGREWVEGHGGRVVLATLKDGYSSTNTLERMERD